MLPVEPEEFRDLQNGSLTEDELARRSERRLRRQKAATAAMEISTDDQYEMYSRLSANAKKLSYPATTKDLWDAFAASPYLASKGATVSTDGVWYLPGSEESCELRATNQRDAITDEVTYLSWGNSAVDELLTAICSKIPNNGPIQRISVQNGSMEMVGYLVASTDGEKLVASIADVNGLHIEPEQKLSKESILAAKQKLSEIFAGDEQKVFHVNNHTQVIFPLAEQNGAVFISAQGILLDCAIEYSKCIASVIKMKKADITTELVLSRIESAK